MHSLTNKAIAIPVFFVLIASLLSGCTTLQATPAPTIDQSTIVAAAVETLSAQITLDALNHPSPTPLPTATPLPPTATPPPPTETQAATAEPTSLPIQKAELSARLVYVVTFPENKRNYVPNEKYGVALGFENTGTLTWQPGSTVRLMDYKGEVTIQTELSVDKEVKPGERVEFDLWAFGSETLGEHVFTFQLYTREGIAIPGGIAVYTYVSE